MMSDFLQYALYYSDLSAMALLLFPVFISIKNKNKQILSFSSLFFAAIVLRHFLTGYYSELPKEDKVFLWYQTFEYLYIAVFIISMALHIVLLWYTSRAIRTIYVLMAVNICFYAFMHWQRNIMGLHEPDWTWDLYTWTVVPVNYIIVGILVFASLKGVQNRNGNSVY
ncbi:hypothetical protein [Thalassomonas haliotis]|uniref:Uncharacterized protein n=1 Tax=Thalassomonas haliotis TaxID=485448 RepID=A0ABY7VCF3_9GAMM|nr:hypothetical protein [Thalassomonas haliotis]WDE11055.1 hypothetical protein H3N35_22905 [Thalassomonas haliotis]